LKPCEVRPRGVIAGFLVVGVRSGGEDAVRGVSAGRFRALIDVVRAGVAGAVRAACGVVVVVAGRGGSTGRRERSEPGEGGGEVLGPGPGPGKPETCSARVEGESSGGVQQPVAQALGSQIDRSPSMSRACVA